MQKSQIIADINAYMLQSGYANPYWYVGIAEDAEDRLFNDHSVDRPGYWIWRQADSSKEAREIEQAYLNAACDGGPGGGSNKTVYVYAYVKTVNTVE